MALIKCIECGKDFSDKASACPSCGCPLAVMQVSADKVAALDESEPAVSEYTCNKQPSSSPIFAIVSIILVILVLIIFYLYSSGHGIGSSYHKGNINAAIAEGKEIADKISALIKIIAFVLPIWIILLFRKLFKTKQEKQIDNSSVKVNQRRFTYYSISIMVSIIVVIFIIGKSRELPQITPQIDQSVQFTPINFNLKNHICNINDVPSKYGVFKANQVGGSCQVSFLHTSGRNEVLNTNNKSINNLLYSSSDELLEVHLHAITEIAKMKLPFYTDNGQEFHVFLDSSGSGNRFWSNDYLVVVVDANKVWSKVISFGGDNGDDYRGLKSAANIEIESKPDNYSVNLIIPPKFNRVGHKYSIKMGEFNEYTLQPAWKRILSNS
jgi:preprotein translocase subunit SecG